MKTTRYTVLNTDTGEYAYPYEVSYGPDLYRANLWKTRKGAQEHLYGCKDELGDINLTVIEVEVNETRKAQIAC